MRQLAALAAGDWSQCVGSQKLLPGSISIARVIIESWAALRMKVTSLTRDLYQLRFDLVRARVSQRRPVFTVAAID